jgi:hypothetical protein
VDFADAAEDSDNYVEYLDAEDQQGTNETPFVFHEFIENEEIRRVGVQSPEEATEIFPMGML